MKNKDEKVNCKFANLGPENLGIFVGDWDFTGPAVLQQRKTMSLHDRLTIHTQNKPYEAAADTASVQATDTPQ